MNDVSKNTCFKIFLNPYPNLISNFSIHSKLFPRNKNYPIIIIYQKKKIQSSYNRYYNTKIKTLQLLHPT